MKAVLLFLLKGYRKYISPLSAPCCRFYPTCSSYAVEAISSHGALRGGYLALKRVLKCHPYHRGGYDPVPPAKEEKPCPGHHICAEEH